MVRMCMVMALVGGLCGSAKAQRPIGAAEEGLMYADSPGVKSIGGGLTHPDVPPGYVIIEGDIQITLAEYAAIRSGADGLFSLNLWTSQVVPYDFQLSGGGAVSAANQAAAIAAMNAIGGIAGITFRPASGGEDRIRFQASTFNNSPIGRQGGTQTINIVSWTSQFTICHEIFHSLGFRHEQCRAERDGYITIHYENICGSQTSTACTPGTGPGQCCGCSDSSGSCVSCDFNFDIQSGARYGSYDFDSIMHYGPFSFSCNGQPTITVNPAFNATIGNRTHFSYFDGVVCRGLYRYPGDRWWAPTEPSGGSGTMISPRNGSFASAVAATPPSGTLFIRDAGFYAAVGTYTNPLTIKAPMGATLGN